MMTRRTLMGFGLAVGGGLGLSSCRPESRKVRYRLMLVAETPEGMKTGSSIVELDWGDQSAMSGFTQGVNWAVSAKGEAVTIDLGSHGLLFALLTADGTRKESVGEPRFVPVTFFRDYFPTGIEKASEGIRQLDALVRAHPKADIPLDTLPMLVRFGDLADPKSVARVDPNDLAASFGPGVKLVRATIEITDDPVTTGIEKRLAWLVGGYPEKRLVAATGGPLRDVPPEQRVTYSDFIKASK